MAHPPPLLDRVPLGGDQLMHGLREVLNAAAPSGASGNFLPYALETDAVSRA